MMVRCCRCFAVLVVFAVSGLESFCQSHMRDPTKSLQDYEQKLAKQRGKIRSLAIRERSLHSELKDYESKMEGLNRDIAKLDLKKTQTNNTISRTEKTIAELEERIRQRDSNVLARLRDLYLWGQPSYLETAMLSRGALSLREQQSYVRMWIDRDQRYIKDFEELLRSLSQQRRELQINRKSQSQLLSQRESRKSELGQEKRFRGELLALVRTQREYYKKSIHELEQAAQNLEKLMASLQREESQRDTLFSAMKGKLSLPVQGRVEKFYGPYQDMTLKTKLHHKGIDVRASIGTEVRSVFDGKVIHAGSFVGYGKVMIVDHGGGYFTLYAHLSEIRKSVGDLVVVGEPIAIVGDSGSLKGAYLYFELRKKGISEDPWPWFSKRNI